MMDDKGIAFSTTPENKNLKKMNASSSSSSSGKAHHKLRSLAATNSTAVDKATKKQKTTEDTSAPPRLPKGKMNKINKEMGGSDLTRLNRLATEKAKCSKKRAGKAGIEGMNQEVEFKKATKRQKRTEDTSAPKERKIKKTKIMAGPAEPPDLPQFIKDKIKNPTFGPMLILQKGFTKNDANKKKNMLSIRINQLESTEFLQEGEKAAASARTHGRLGLEIKGFDVTVIDHVGDIIRGEEGKVKFKELKIGHSDCYVLKGAWHRDFMNKNGLKKDDIIQVWFYRDADHNLCFAIVKL